MTIDQIADLANTKRRTVVDWISKGRLKPALKHQVPGKAGAAVSLFYPAEVDELLRQRAAAKSEVLPASAPGPLVRTSPAALTKATDYKPSSVRPEFLAAAATGREVWLTIPEAHLHNGLPEACLLRLIHDGKLKAMKAGAWYVRRRDLDKL